MANLNPFLNIFFLANDKKKMSTETYQTYADFQIDFLHDESGRTLWSDNLFLNIYDFWIIRQDGYLLRDYKTKNSLLNKNDSERN